MNTWKKWLDHCTLLAHCHWHYPLPTAHFPLWLVGWLVWTMDQVSPVHYTALQSMYSGGSVPGGPQQQPDYPAALSSLQHMGSDQVWHHTICSTLNELWSINILTYSIQYISLFYAKSSFQLKDILNNEDKFDQFIKDLPQMKVSLGAPLHLHYSISARPCRMRRRCCWPATSPWQSTTCPRFGLSVCLSDIQLNVVVGHCCV